MAADRLMLKAVRHQPDDDTAALAAADALQENGLGRFAALRTVVANRRAGRLTRRRRAVAARLRHLGEEERFFYRHAEGSYRPGVEIAEEGRLNYARRLAAAERWLLAREADGLAEWEWVRDDDYNPADYDPPEPPDTVAWGCIVRVRDDDQYWPDGDVASVWAVTFDGDGEPTGSGCLAYGRLKPYARVVRAELALELMTRDR